MNQKQEEKPEVWRQRITEHEKGSQPVRAYCREHGIGEHTFYYWRQRFRREGKPVAFALIETKPGTTQASSTRPLELVLASGDLIRIPADAAILRLVLNVLREERPGA